MFIAIIGIIILIAGMVIKHSPSPNSHYSGIITIAGVVVVVLGLFSSSVKVIDKGTIGVQSFFGKVQPDVLEAGLHIIDPVVDVTVFDAKTQNYTMSAQTDEGQKKGDDAIKVLSSDGLEVTIDITVLYRLIPSKTPYLLQNIGADYIDNIVRPVSRTAILTNAVNYEAVELYSTKRGEFQAKIQQNIGASLAKNGMELQSILLRNISLPASVKASIESKINAEQDAQKMQFVLQKEKQEAERKRVEAQGIADYQKILSTGLSDKQLQYETIKAQKEIALSPNAKVIILGNGKGAPIILGKD
ncbi:regulator of protease activity HflC (stomatin/prohibitin superfamily) [Mucilaginibacter gracilis]|uniref:Regulator of protease activity HflC (Stomatin/prohibitin superfamily) n=1 Tax=Mucilaginibacter gracilis TaxID=423350 RepID=A0A495IX69_9SPHI|nr:prohibitin family protein [Mucilaginibacter gracilis]RKR81275.1 regulator of protease activity HflC (stomatin/prohibitin superfamily) [Mucilaginibacter gracilis]